MMAAKKYSSTKVHSLSKRAIFLLLWALFCFPKNGYAQNNIVLSISKEVSMDNDHLQEVYHYAIQVNNKNGDWISSISIPYNEDDKLNITEGYIVDAFGREVRKLKKKDIISRNDISRGTFYADNLLKEFSLKHNTYPYIIRYSYQITRKSFVNIARWYPSLYLTVPTLKASLSVNLPSSYEVGMAYDKQFFNYQTKTTADGITHQWEANDIPAWEKETLGIPAAEGIPHVIVTPKYFSYGGAEGSTVSWAKYGQWVDDLNSGLDELTATEKTKVHRLIAGKKDPKAIIQTLYQYMQEHTRYINVSIDEGGLKPYPASYVCENKYGDCKALTIYMKALLKEAGLTSYVADVYAGDTPVRINHELPSQQFNHVILYVPLESDTVWLENTSNYLPAGYLGTFTQNRWVLSVNREESRLITTPALKPADTHCNISYHLYPDESGLGKIEIDGLFRGEYFEELKYISTNFSARELKRYQKDFSPFEVEEWTNWELAQPDSTKPLIQLNGATVGKNLFRKLGKSLVLQNPTGFLPDFEKPEERKQAVVISFPVYETTNLQYHLSFDEQYEIKLPAPVSIESPYGKFSQEYRYEKGLITIEYSFLLYANRYELKEYADFYGFIQSISDAINSHIAVLNLR